MDPPAHLSIEVEQRAEGLIVRLVGDAGLKGIQILERAAVPLSARRPALLVLDLSRLTFIGSLGIGILVALAHGVKMHGGITRIAVPEGSVSEALFRCGLDRVISIVPTLDGALATPS
jgi:anti-sigma B factor antagonist